MAASHCVVRDEGKNVDSKYFIDTDGSLVRVQVWGELRAHDLIKLMRSIGADPRHRPDMGAIIDLREAHGHWDYSEIQRLRDYAVRIANPHHQRRWAAIVSPGTLVAAAHVFIVISEQVAGSIRMQLFDDVQSALRWVQGARIEQDAAVATVD